MDYSPLPASRDRLSRGQVPIGAWLELLRPNVAVVLPKETQSIAYGPLIKDLGVMGNQDELPVVIRSTYPTSLEDRARALSVNHPLLHRLREIRQPE
jgi:hypothetical protein